MSAVNIPNSERAVEQFRQPPKQQQNRLKEKAAALLEQEISQTVGADVSLSGFQEAIQMTDEDMVLTFGEDYLVQRNWQPRHA